MTLRYNAHKLYMLPQTFAAGRSPAAVHVTSVLTVDRATAAVGMSSPPPTEEIRACKKKTVYGVLGLFRTPSGQAFLVVITRKVRVGELAKSVVWRVDEVEVFHVKPRVEPDEEEEHLKKMLIYVLSTPYFYYSYTLDLTQSQQSLFPLLNDDNVQQRPILDRCDARFVWNLHLLEDFVNLAKTHSGAHAFLVPVIHGAIFISRCTIEGKTFNWSIVSRRSNRRVGARLFVRGCDDDGNVANFVETEQIVEHAGALSSFVQTRGSMPMYWQQWANIQYKPDPKMLPYKDSMAGFMAHFRQQVPLYGEQVMVNLIDQKRAEGELELTLRNLHQEAGLSNVHYVAFDFHKECKKMRYDRLSILIDKLKPFIANFDYFFIAHDDPSSYKRQKGVFRTNCIDCLDRTNVVQSLLATENLEIVLKRLNLLRPGSSVKDQWAFQEIYRNVWADHADMISVQYAGTGALKTDFTRTGKRSYYGVLQDGWNASNRYFLNNFMDGTRTDANRLFVGETSADRLVQDRRKKAASSKTVASFLPVMLFATLILLVFLLLFTKEVSVQFFTFTLLSNVFVVLISKLILQHGHEFVNAPLTHKVGG